MTKKNSLRSRHARQNLANIVLFVLASFFVWNVAYPIPGSIMRYDVCTKMPIIAFESLDLTQYSILKVFKPTDLPATSNWQDHATHYQNRNRSVYLTADRSYVLKIFQPKHAAVPNFLAALEAGFYEGIAPLAAVIFDNDSQCRGYITKYLIDREGNRTAWESYGLVVEKGPIGVKIFAPSALQPIIYKKLFDKLIARSTKTQFVSYDLSPNNIAIDPTTAEVYLIDLEDVQPLHNLDKPIVSTILKQYNPYDYIEKMHQLKELLT